MNMGNLKDTLNRTVKMAMDSGEAATLQEAKDIFSCYRFSIEVGPDIANSPTRQALVLTALNTARRCFLGGVTVTGAVDVPLLVPWENFTTLAEAIIDLRGTIVDRVPDGVPRLVVGDESTLQGDGEFAIRGTFDGWAGGVIPIEDGLRLPEANEFIPAGVLAGAIAVSEAFQYIRGDNALAGHRPVGLSLWDPTIGSNWLTSQDCHQVPHYLPANLWLMGLGHLGQAFLWTLGLLNYKNPEEVNLTLQDFDVLSESNESTSLLTFSPIVREHKTRELARWCERRGFATKIIERRFSKGFIVQKEDPAVAICGVDNALARAELEEVGFTRIIEAGLGNGDQEYLAFEVHTFPGPRKAVDRWGTNHPNISDLIRLKKPAYEALAQEGLDECGITTLAGRTVGASFVGAAVSALMVGELLRMINEGPAYAIIDGTLRNLDNLSCLANHQWKEPFNPGVTRACCY